MSARRAPQAPPELPGFTHLDVLGSGGFADVFLYEQHLPRRRVAVKVLLTERMSSDSVSEFTAEANVMAMLSTHPAIVTIHQAGVAGDGRPYLVMEYCPKPNLQVRYRREPFSVAESLRVGVQVAGAVETAHRAGVLHRDIKPANILVTEYNRPALTDFGIASTTAAAGESAGLSIPWSPPESFADEPRSDRRSDVYALGATVYTLLAGRSPFELAGQRNTAADLIQRIESTPLPALGRPDAPASLQHVLQRAMATSPADRYVSALDFARALQKVQIELSHAVTPVDILDDALSDDVDKDDGDDGLTRVRGVVSIEPETAPAAGRTRPSAQTPPAGAPAT
ncbi:MAG: serine/threonine-protein kinase, partial [Microbacterium sp.]